MKKFKYSLFFTAFLTYALFAEQGAQGGGDGYMWTDMETPSPPDTVITYDWIDVRDGSAAHSGAFNDELSSATDIGFNFDFYGNTYTQIFISTNGWFSFSDPGGPVPGNLSIPAAGAPDDLIAVYWDDLVNDAGSGGVFYETIGSAPNRKFIVQWVLNDFGGGPGVIEFQVILHETSNLIKMQWAQIAGGYNNGLSATVGLQNVETSAVEYSFNAANIEPYSAVLFHGEGVNSADATITPTSVDINTLQQFTYTIDNVLPLTDGLGKIDTASIDIPVEFSSSPIVTGIDVNGISTFIQNSTAKPTEGGFATWNYNGSAIQVQTADFEVVNSIDVSFYLQTPAIPTTGSPVDFTSSFGAILDTNAMQATTEIEYSVDVTPVIDYYSFTPANDTSVIAGDNLDFTVTAHDINGDPISNTETVVISAIGATGVNFTPSNTLVFAGATANVTISKNETSTFTLKATQQADPNITGTSGSVTVNPDAVNSISVLSSSADIIAGAERLIRVRLLDQFSNPVLADTTVDFAVQTGTGSFDVASSTTNSNGEAEATYTAPTIAGGTETLRVSYNGGAVFQDIILNVIAGPVSYYTLTPSADSTITAGETIQFAVTAKDQYGNDRNNTDQFSVAGQGSSSEEILPLGSGPYTFSGSSVLITVSDTVSGEFTVVATNTVDSNIKGTSGTITVDPEVADQFSILSSQGNIVAGTSRILDVGLEDRYGNRLGSGNTVTFTRFQGSGLFSNGLAAMDGTTTADGTADVTYTASATAGSTDRIQVAFGAVLDTIDLPVVTGTLAEIRIQTAAGDGGAELDDFTLNADQSLTVFSEGYDAQGNYTGVVSVTWGGTGVVNGNIPAGPSTSAVFSAVQSGSGKITATNGSINDISGTITVDPGATVEIRIMDEPGGTGNLIPGGSIMLGEIINLFANGFDADGNFSADESVTWGVTGSLDAGDLDPATGSSTVYMPQTTGIGTIEATSAFPDANTGIFAVNEGSIASLRIRTAANNAGIELQDTVLFAGDTPTFYAAAYDNYGNFIGDSLVTWTIEKIDGDSIGFFSTATATDNNTFNATVVNTGRIKIEYGAIADYSGTIKIKNGTPASLVAISNTSFSGSAGATIGDSLVVLLRDAFFNPVPDSTINWTTPNNGSLNPANVVTNSNGRARTAWTLRDDVAATDQAFAGFGALTPVEFTANVNPSDANQISLSNGNGQNATAGTTVPLALEVLVEDQFNIPVSGVPVEFFVTSVPNGATGYSLGQANDISDGSGLASTTFTLGDKVGTYVVSASNAELSGSPISFTLTANADVVNQLVLFSGNNQSGTVNTTLGNNVVVRAEDQYGNPVQGVDINWTAVSGGSIDDLGSTLTDATGLDAADWTLTTVAGGDTITATDAGATLNTVTFTATANPDVANDIVVVSGNNTSTIAGGFQQIVARVIDQYGNGVPSASGISFAPLNRMSAIDATPNANGEVSAVYRTPSTVNSSVATATLASPLSTANFTVYGMRYVAGSLSPISISSGDTVDFYVDLNNPGPNDVQIDTSQSYFLITTGSFSDSVTVDSPLVLTNSQVNTIKFKSMIVSGNFDGGSYTPEITLVGDGPDSTINGSFITDPGGLSVSPLEITLIDIPGPEDTLSVARGGNFPVQMTVRNNGSNTLDTFIPSLTFSSPDAFTVGAWSGPASITGGSQGTFSNTVTVPTNASVGVVTMDGQVTAEIEGTANQVMANGSTVTDAFRVIDATDVSWLSYTPGQISDGQNVTFTVSVQNDGPFDLVLDSDNTSISFGANTFNLAINYVLDGAGATSVLTFDSGNLSVADNTPAILQLAGTEEGNPFTLSFSSDTLGAINNLTVQTPANVVFNSDALSAGTVSQGSLAETYTISVTNTGQADAIISRLDSIKIFANGVDISANYQKTLLSGQTFPFSLTGGPEIFTFNIDVNDDAIPGTDVFTSQIVYGDNNSGVNTTTASADNPSWDVLAKSAFAINTIDAVDAQVTQNGGPYTVDVTVVNTGGAQATLDTVYLEFQKNTNSFTTATVWPLSIPGGDSSTISFAVNVDADAATGVDQIRAVAQGSNSLTGENIALTSTYLDSWQVNPAGSVSINAVTSTFSQVNRGQQDVPVTVSVTNTGTTDINITDVVLANTPLGSTVDTRITPLGVIAAGQTRAFAFQSDIEPAAADTIILGASFTGTDAVTGDPVADVTAAIADTFFVSDPSALEIDSVFASFTTFTQGQTSPNLDVRVQVTNTGSSNVRLDSVQLDLTGAVSTLGYTQITATLPTLAAGANTVVLFRLTSAATPLDPGLVTIDASAFGTDVLSQTAQSDLSAAPNTAEVTLQTPANPLATVINNHPANVAVGETNVTVDVTIENQGGATARIDNTTLNFSNSSFVNRNQDYSRELVEDLPFNLLGGQDTTVTFNISVLETAEQGTIDMSALVQSTELNRNLTIINRDTLSSWTVLGSGAVSILSVSSDRDSVSAGHQDVPVDVIIRNGGATEARIDSVLLSFSRGTYDSTFIAPVSGNILATSTQDTFTVFVDIDPASVSGVSTISARAVAFDTENLVALPDAIAQQGDSWLIQQPFNLTITDNSPVVVSTDQDFTHSLLVQNTGEARLVIDIVNTEVYPSTLPGSGVLLGAATPLVIEGNQSVTLPFTTTNSPAPLVDDVILNLFGTENGVPFNQQYTAPNQLTVQQQAAMVIDSTVAAQDSVSQGETPAVTVYITNTGEADLIVNTLTFAEYGAFTPTAPVLPATVAGGVTSAFSGTVNVSALTATGDVVLAVSATGEDANSAVAADDADADVPDSWFVTTAPLVSISNITSVDTLVEQGQTGLIIDVTIRNDGETPVDLTNVTLNPDIGLYDPDPAVGLGRLNGNDSVTVSINLDVLSNSATGTDTIGASVNYDNIYSGQSSQVASIPAVFHEWEIVGSASLIVVSVQTAPVTVSQGQGPVNVQVQLQNNGDASVSIQAVDLVFANGAANYAVGAVAPGLPLSIPAGLPQAFTIPVTVDNLAQLGLDSISASVTYTSAGTTPPPLADPRINDTWQVQSAPVVQVDSVRVNPDMASNGQQGLVGSVYLSNVFAANRATAQIDEVDILMLQGVTLLNDQFSINRVATPTIPFDLQPGESNRIDFNMGVNSDALTGLYTAEGAVVFQDINTATPDTTTAAVDPGQLIVEDVALLTVDEIIVSPDTVSQGQTQGMIYVLVTNNGVGSAEITSASLTPDPLIATLNPVYLSPQTPFVITGGATDTISYSFTAPTDYLGLVDINAEVNGEDINSGSPLTAISVVPGTFLVQSPADLRWVDSSPPASDGNENIQFTVEIANDGEAAIQLNSSTILEMADFDIQLDASSPTVLTAGDTTILIFETTFLTGIPLGQNYSLTLNLFGTSNEAAYSEVLAVGSIGYGAGLIYINSVTLQGARTRFQQDQNIVVNMNVFNNSAETLTIDPSLVDETYIELRDPVTDAVRSVDNLTREDSFTDIGATDDRTLSFSFDLPIGFPLGVSNIYGRISLDGQNVEIFSDTLDNVYDSLLVISPAQVAYVGPTTPVEVVPEQSVSFSMAFENSGSAGLSLNSDSSYIELPGTPPNRLYLSGNFTIPGGGTTAISFNSFTFPPESPVGSYDITWHLFGQMLNGDTISFDGVATNAFDVVENAYLVFNTIDIVEDQARQGQDSVQINFEVVNTGGSNAILDFIDYNFEKEGLPVNVDWLATTTGLYPDTVFAGATNNYNVYFTVPATADTGFIVPAPIANYRDQRVPGIPRTSIPADIVSNDQIDIVAPATIQLDSLFFHVSGNTPNSPFVNIDQSFVLAVSITNTGDADIASGTITLKRNNQTIPPSPINFSTPLASGETRIVQFPARTESTQGQPVFTAELSNVLDVGGFAVIPDQSPDNSETVIVQLPRTLSLASLEVTSPASAQDGSVTVGQSFFVVATVASSGQSNFNPGTLQLSLPPNFSATGDTIRIINSSTLAITWNLTALAASTGDPDTISVAFADIPDDVNTGFDVATGFDEQKLPMDVVTTGTITNITFVKTGPIGARDSISTSQQFMFSLSADFSATLVNRTATLNLPVGGYSVVDSVTKPYTGSAVSWTVVAPADKTEETPSQADFNATVIGEDVNTAVPTERTSVTRTLTLQKRAEISMSTIIVGPPGAIDKSVSTEQQVILRTRAVNPAENAAFKNNGTFQMYTTNGAVFIENGLPVDSVSHTNFGTAANLDTLQIPSLTGTVDVGSFITTANLPTDVNSDQPVLLRVDSSNHTLQVVRRADLSLTFDIEAPSDTLVRATNQNFQLSALVTNSGAAAIDGDEHRIILDTLNTGLQLAEGQDVEQAFTIGNPVTWLVKTSLLPDTVTVSVHVDNESAPIDVNDNQNAFRSEAAKSDALVLNIFPVKETQVVASFDSLITENSVTVGRNQDSIYVEAIVTFDPQLNDNRYIELRLPGNAGFSILEGSNRFDDLPDADTVKVSWLIKARQTENLSGDIIRIFAHGQNDEDPTLFREGEASLNIVTIPKASLNLVINIVEPDGARNGVVTMGQQFRLEGIITTPEGTAVSGTGKVAISFDSEYFSLVGNPAEIDFTESVPFSWWIETRGVTPSGLDIPGIYGAISSGDAIAIPDAKNKGKALAKEDSDKKKSLNALNKHMKKLGQLLAEGLNLSVSITDPPDDAILGVPADREQDDVIQNVVIVPEASIAVQSLSSPDTVSTSQPFNFTVQADPDSKTLNFTVPTAAFIIPPNLTPDGVLDTTNVNLSSESLRATYSLAVPSNYKGDGTETIRVYLWGEDGNNSGVLVKMADTLKTITIQQRPNITIKSAIIKPTPTNNTVQLSYRQEVTINVWPELAPNTSGLEYAGLDPEGEDGQITLVQSVITEQGFKLSDGESSVKSFAYDAIGPDHPITWKLRAPRAERQTDVTFQLTELPEDVNSGLDALSAANSTSSVVRVRQKEIVIRMRDDLIKYSSFIQGNPDVPLFAFDVSNEGNTDSLFVNAIQLKFFSSGNQELDDSELADIFSSLKVFDYDSLKFGKLAKTSEVFEATNFADGSVDETSSNPFDLDFNVQQVELKDSSFVTLVVAADISDNARNISFIAQMSDLTVFDVADTIKLKLVDKDGNDFLSGSGNSGQPVVVTPKDPEKSFYVYPNPFGRAAGPDTDELAHFQFTLERNSNVKIQVFTLLGELVWTSPEYNLPGGNYPNLIHWDGRNDSGKKILNGVYIGALIIKPDNGGTKRFITKIAYIK